MKFEHLYFFYLHFSNFILVFYRFFLINNLNHLILNYFFNWKILNYAESYWFLYNNKKTTHELRYI